ncbi:tyrosine-type recombinase/integrase [Streptomyces ipomoeae]|uniref:tyrosine-type recombinase/integrase n=1 Tax=Streptomyces ipomoeae TaxID=103232 RepID=UPI00131A47BF|nr:site-specific integrase [Streptomyces ipomoeae]MDX2698907.1 tyrosine-type recombinase/integrase [Streptomyces ipomoeae]MDX2844164.1 tyrosine-type recombinase/integrase [Streptomyces ipomoeae]
MRVYGATRAEVSQKLTEIKANHNKGVPVADKAWLLADYLDYWLEAVVKKVDKPKTYEDYECVARLYLKPNIGNKRLTDIRVQTVRALLGQLLEQGHSPRRLQTIKTTLSAALTYAMREELIGRNVARLAETPTYKPKKKAAPWTPEEAQQFWEVAKEHRLSGAWCLALFYGPRRGEILGLRWQDVDLVAGEIQLTQQLQKVKGELLFVSLKTESSERPLPILGVLREELVRLKEARKESPPSEHDLVFTSTKGTPIDPRNFSDRTFKRLCKLAGVRNIRFHDTRHTVTSMLDFLGVQLKVAQTIMGHSSALTTQQYYQHAYDSQIENALELVEQTLQTPKTAQSDGTGRLMDVLDGCRQVSRQSHFWHDFLAWIISGGPTGARTQDTLLKRSVHDTVNKRVTEVDALLQDRRRRWVLGVVAVSAAVKNTGGEDVELAA